MNLTGGQRYYIGGVAVLLVLAGLWGVLSNDGVVFGAILLRAGLVLLAIWIALPQLMGSNTRVSLISIGVIVVLTMVAASRPRYFAIVAIGGIVFFFLQTIVRRFSQALRNKPPDEHK